MSFVSGIIWCIIALSACYLTMKYFVPKYCQSEKTPNASDKLKDSCETITRSKILDSKRAKIIFFVMIGLYSAVVGWFASNNAAGVISYAKISLCMLIVFMVVTTDLELSVIPNVFVLVLLLGRLIFFIVEFFVPGIDAVRVIINNFLVALIVGIFLFIMSRLTRGGLGAGDIKLFSSIAFLCGLNAVVFTLIFALLATALFSIILLILKKKQMRDSFPMGPFIGLGCGLTVILALA